MNILILGDFVGCGDVAMATSRAVLTHMGHSVLCLPTALISNTWNLGTPATAVTTPYIRDALKSWEEKNIRVDAVLLGYIADEEQAQWLACRCREWHTKGTTLFWDPIFADEGRLYHGISEERLVFLKQLLPNMDYVLPNLTEAQFLAGVQEPEKAALELTKMGAGTAVVTGVNDCCVLLSCGGETRSIPYEPIPGHFSGTGDAFTALFAGMVMSGKDAQQSVQAASETVTEWIKHYLCSPSEITGLPVEQLWD